jgi:hypothetical protein
MLASKAIKNESLSRFKTNINTIKGPTQLEDDIIDLQEDEMQLETADCPFHEGR